MIDGIFVGFMAIKPFIVFSEALYTKKLLKEKPLTGFQMRWRGE
jgi:hypothetical protein